MLELPQPLTEYAWNQIIRLDVDRALSEDLNGLDADNDVTGQLLPTKQMVTASLITREAGVLAGQNWFERAFSTIDKTIDIHWNINDGESFKANETLATIHGNARSILTAERTAMNFLQTLSATATQTAEIAGLIHDLPCRLLDTRKTLPGLRMAQKYAVHCGGGFNHRIGLYDRFLIKENHIMAAGGIENAINQALKINQLHRKNTQNPLIIEVEVESLAELEKAITAGADIIMLDNFTPEQCKAAVALREQLCPDKSPHETPCPLLEASGNIDHQTILSYAQTGIDYISSGAITKNITAIDLSLRINI